MLESKQLGIGLHRKEVGGEASSTGRVSALSPVRPCSVCVFIYCGLESSGKRHYCFYGAQMDVNGYGAEAVFWVAFQITESYLSFRTRN